MIHPILQQVSSRIESLELAITEAAAEIGVTSQSLLSHLRRGAYVRSDSLAKYRLWLETSDPANATKGRRRVRSRPPEIMSLDLRVREGANNSVAASGGHDEKELWTRMHSPAKPHRVVDIFSGCGGLSLGFDHMGVDHCDKGRFFQTVLALDIEEPMIRVFNDNHPSSAAELPRGRVADVTDFLNEAEIQAFYLDHLARSGQDAALVEELRDIAGYDLGVVRAHLQLLDQEFLEQLNTLRDESKFVAVAGKLGGKVLGQTSVIAFHRALRLPVTAQGAPRFEMLLWSADGAVPALKEATLQPDALRIREAQGKARRLWDDEVERLREKTSGNGTGQLSSSARRIREFVNFISSEAAGTIRSAWARWRARRDSLRAMVFADQRVQNRLQQLYNQGREVAVLLGGPPCQGFSRIGRGKIRSLREQSVHAHDDEDSGDSRNQLLEQYVLFVSALAPRIFLFENVRHFQAAVRVGDRTFDAAETLAEAIKSVSERGLSYSVGSQIVDASKHLVPQVRERYLMAGLRAEVEIALAGVVEPQWCIQLPSYPEVALEIALEGLPEPAAARDEPSGGDGNARVQVSGSTLECSKEAKLLREWICAAGETVADSHIARRPRADDAAFFDLMGPGKRWMDYRCDEAPTLKRLKQLTSNIKKAIARAPALAEKLSITGEDVRELEQLLDGSLSLRLLLESIAPLPGEPEHHLLNPNYLKKRDGQHGDWLSRMDPARPSKTMVSHMAKDTYAYVHPTRPRTLSVREAARIQTFPDNYRFRSVGLVDAFRMIGNAVPPLLSAQFAKRVAQVLWRAGQHGEASQVVQFPVPGAVRLNVAV